jgi:hypothetical protein
MSFLATFGRVRAVERRLLVVLLLLALAGCGQPLRVASDGAEGRPTTAAPGGRTMAALPTPPRTTIPPPTAAPFVASAQDKPPAATPTNEQRWRAQQADREVFPPQVFLAKRPVTLWWWDPTTGQSLEVGTIIGPVTAQARFIFRPRQAPALEVPYRLNIDFGLTAVSPVVIERMKAAGSSESVEAYVLLDGDSIVPKQ